MSQRCTVFKSAFSNAEISSMIGTEESYWEREVSHWLREEQRWLREEQRWLREETRWNAERKALVEQSAALMDDIKILKQEIERSRCTNVEEKTVGALANLTISLATLLDSLNKEGITVPELSRKLVTQTQIPSATSASTGLIGALNNISSQPLKENLQFAAATDIHAAVIPKVVQAMENLDGMLDRKDSMSVMKEKYFPGKPENKASEGNQAIGNKRWALKRGSQGHDVKEIQEALACLGFYSGDDDLKYSCFSNGTEHAVKAWQESIGVAQDGIVTSHLFESLCKDKVPNSAEEDNADDTSGSSTPEIVKVDLAGNIAFKGDSMEASHRRVYLLGENRWEDPDRLVKKNGYKSVKTIAGEKCFACRGEGRCLCTDCEGTGELNVEEQFLEWAEDAKCPYCDGSGTITCDLCDGKGVRTSIAIHSN
eukprot:c28477_g1_i1 orf=655-1935(-)